MFALMKKKSYCHNHTISNVTMFVEHSKRIILTTISIHFSENKILLRKKNI